MNRDNDLAALAARLGEVLQQRGWRLSTAESCTGGWVAKLVTDIAGSSAWFDRGWVTYSNEAKQEQLGVPAAVLAEHGAVSEPVVQAMAAGALRASSGDVAVAISGIAGPGGGSADKPVGTVWFAWADRAGEMRTLRRVFPGDREAVRRAAVVEALGGVLGMAEMST